MTDESERSTFGLPDAGLSVRLASMIYEAVLLLGVAFVVSYALLATFKWSYPLLPIERIVLQGALFAVAGAYFVVCWDRSGQTLALKAWRLKVVDSEADLHGSAGRSRGTCWRGTSGCPVGRCRTV